MCAICGKLVLLEESKVNADTSAGVDIGHEQSR